MDKIILNKFCEDEKILEMLEDGRIGNVRFNDDSFNANITGTISFDIEDVEGDMHYFSFSDNGAMYYGNSIDLDGTEIYNTKTGETVGDVEIVPELIDIEKRVENRMEELQRVCGPIIEYLKAHYDPHCEVVISTTQIRLVRSEIGIPVDEIEEAPEMVAQEQHKFIPQDSNGICKEKQGCERSK